MIINEILSKSIITKSKLPASDFCANPYIGCPHKCMYCYACYMKIFTKHDETWGEFIDIKYWEPILSPQYYNYTSINIGSATDPYNPYEATYNRTRTLLQELLGTTSTITIVTKSSLVVRDLDLLKQFPNLTVAFSINTTNESFKNDMDKASSISDRINAMRILHESGVNSATFISPIFPEITNVPNIISATRDYCSEYWTENLNLRAPYKHAVLQYIYKNYSNLHDLYCRIYNFNDQSYWDYLEDYLIKYALSVGVKMINYFHHEKIRKS